MTKRVSLTDMDMSVIAPSAPNIQRTPSARVEPGLPEPPAPLMQPVSMATALRPQKRKSEREDAMSKGFRAVNWYVKPSTRDRLHDIAKLRRKYVYEVLDEVLGRFIEEEYSRTLRSMAAESEDEDSGRKRAAANG